MEERCADVLNRFKNSKRGARQLLESILHPPVVRSAPSLPTTVDAEKPVRSINASSVAQAKPGAFPLDAVPLSKPKRKRKRSLRTPPWMQTLVPIVQRLLRSHHYHLAGVRAPEVIAASNSAAGAAAPGASCESYASLLDRFCPLPSASFTDGDPVTVATSTYPQGNQARRAGRDSSALPPSHREDEIPVVAEGLRSQPMDISAGSGVESMDTSSVSLSFGDAALPEVVVVPSPADRDPSSISSFGASVDLGMPSTMLSSITSVAALQSRPTGSLVTRPGAGLSQHSHETGSTVKVLCSLQRQSTTAAAGLSGSNDERSTDQRAPGPATVPLAELDVTASIQQFTSHDQVAQFARRLVIELVPRSLLGSKHNMTVLLSNVTRFVMLRRHESMTVHQVMQHMRLSDCKWLSKAPPEHAPSAKRARTSTELHASSSSKHPVTAAGRKRRRLAHGHVANDIPSTVERVEQDDVGSVPVPFDIDDVISQPLSQSQSADSMSVASIPVEPAVVASSKQEVQEAKGRDSAVASSESKKRARSTVISAAECSRNADTLARIIQWIFDEIVAVALRTAFYCTDSETYRNRVLFYRRPIWHRLKTHALTQLTAPITSSFPPPLIPLGSADRGRGLSFQPNVSMIQPAITTAAAGKGEVEPNGAPAASSFDDSAMTHRQYAQLPSADVSAVFSAPKRQLGFASLRLVPRATGEFMRFGIGSIMLLHAYQLIVFTLQICAP
jgi:hypothetical protein